MFSSLIFFVKFIFMEEKFKYRVIITRLLASLFIMLYGCKSDIKSNFDNSKNANFINNFLSLNEAERILKNAYISYPQNHGVWYSQIDTLRKQNYVMDYFKETGSGNISGVINMTDSFVLMNIATPDKSKLVFCSYIDQIINPTTGVGVVYKDIWKTLYMETNDLNVYNNWIYQLKQRTDGYFINIISAFEEKYICGLSTTPVPPNNYFTVTFKINNYSNSGKTTSIKPIVYSVTLKQSYKPS